MQSLREHESIVEDLKDLFIFRTNINSRHNYAIVEGSLLQHRGVHACTIDLEDCDKVLRVESENIPISVIVEEVVKLGFICEELAD
jgi:hypothetical protein